MAPQGWTSIVATVVVLPLAELIRRRTVGASDERLRLMADNIAQLTWMADEHGSVFWMNRRCLDYTGLDFDEMIGQGWTKLIRPDHHERVSSGIDMAFQSGTPWRETYPLRARNGSYHWFLTEAIPLRDKRGLLKYWFGTSTDITLQVETEQDLNRLKDALELQIAERTAAFEGQADQLHSAAMELTGAEQRERDRLARVLHDDLQQLLVGAKIQAAAACRPGSPPERAAAVDRLLEQAIETSRSLSKELAPATLYEKGLGAALHWLGGCAQERYGFAVEVHASESADIEDLPLQLFLFDVVRELLLNVAKHANAKTARLRFVRTEREAHLVVEDFGTGFDAENAKRARAGSGLVFIEHRIQLIGGSMKIDSEPGTGTRIDIRVPLKSSLEEEVLARGLSIS